MTIWSWAHGAQGVSLAPAATHQFKIHEGLEPGQWYERVILGVECTYGYFISDFSTLPVWYGTAVGLRIQQYPGADDPPNIADINEDWMYYQQLFWDQQFVPLGADSFSAMYYAPRGGDKFDAKGVRSIYGVRGFATSLWLAVGTAFEGSVGPGYAAREFNVAWTAHVLVGTP